MATKRVITDTDFGQIIIRTRLTARNISMRTKPDGLHVTVPPRCLTSKVMEVIEEYRPRLLENWKKVVPQALDLNFRLDTPCFKLHMELGRYSRFEENSTSLSASSLERIGRALRIQLQKSENNGKQKPLGQLFGHRKHQSVLLPDAASSTPDGLCFTP